MTRWSRSAGVLAVGVAMVLGACSGGGSSGPSWVDQARVAPAELPIADDDLDTSSAAVGCEPLGVDQPASASPSPTPPAGSGTVDRGTGNDPYTATGARQLPGPDMARLAPPAGPVSVVVARPVDPDEHVAARQADRVDTGPVPPSRYEPGRGSPAFSGAADDPAPTTTTAPTADGGGTTGGTTGGADEGDGGADGGTAAAPCVPVLGP